MTRQKEENKRMRVLVIDDDAGIRESLSDLLTMEDFDCAVAENGQEGLAMVEAMEPNLVVTDVQLPDMSGYQICQSVKRDPATKHLPVVMITGRFT
jgi:CheY-like chemotaxis protein